MKRLSILCLLGALALAACGGASTAPDEQASTAESSTSTAVSSGPVSSGVVAEDFSTVLADGSTFVLSEQTKPTYLVFWAEW